MALVRQLDLVALAGALPIFALAGLPLAGWALGAGVWLVQKGLQILFERRVRDAEDPRTVVGYTAGGAIARGWLAALSVLVIGLLTGPDVGLSAVVLILVLFTVYFVVRVIERAQGSAGASS